MGLNAMAVWIILLVLLLLAHAYITTTHTKGLLNETNSTFSLKGLDTMLSLPMGGSGGVPGGSGASSASSSSSAIRRVKLSDFEPYLGALGEAYDKYQLHRAMGLGAATEGIPELSRKKKKLLLSKEGEQTDPKVAAPSPADEDLSASFSSLEEWTARLAMAGSHASAQLPPLRSTGQPQVSSNAPANTTTTATTTKGPVAPLTLSKTRMYSGNAPPVSSLPALYFEPTFSLGNPHTFAAVCEYADVTGISSSESFTTQRLLQEKLSHYLDVVEVHLIKEISTRAPSFFGALANLQALHQETQACVDRITELRDRLKKLSDTSIKKGLQIARFKRMRGNLDLFYGTVRLASEMKQTQPMIQVLLNEGDYVGALELIDHAGRYLKGQALYSGGGTTNGSPMGAFGNDATDIPAIKELGPGVELHTTQSVIASKIELKNVKCLGTLSTQLVEVSRTIFSVMEADLVSILMKDLTEIVSTPIGIQSTKEKQRGFVSEKLRGSPVDSWVTKILSHSSANANASAGSPTAFEHMAAELSPPTEAMLAKEEVLKTRLLPVILGLLRINRLEDALSTFKERLLTEIKTWSKKVFFNCESNQNNFANL
jgi:hypothetical protein